MSPLSLLKRAVFAVLILAALPVPGITQAQEPGSVAERVAKLEAEIAALKAVVSRLESLVRARSSIVPGEEPGAATPPEGLASRVNALEIQIGALTNQIEQLGGQMRADGAPQAAAEPEADIMEALRDEPSPQTHAAPLAPPPAIPQTVDETDPSKPRWYGPRPGQENDDKPRSITPPGFEAGADDASESIAARPDENAQALYEEGYGDFLKREYAGAEKTFSKLANEYPNDPLAGSAQYWAGESQYVRKQYKKAADTFLDGYRKYSGSDKAPDMLLRLGMSLAALGEKDAACNSFRELDDKFPDAPDDVRNQAKVAAGKAGC